MNSILLTTLLVSAGTSILFSLKSHGKSLLDKIGNLVKGRFIYTVRVYQYDQLFYMLEEWLFEYYASNYRDVEVTTEWGRPDSPPTERRASNREAKLYYRQEDNTIILRRQGKRIVIDSRKEKMEKAGGSLKETYFRKYAITGYRCRKQIDALLKEIIQFSESKKDEARVNIFTTSSYSDWNSFGSTRVKSIDQIILRGDIRDLLINDLEVFLSSEAWYAERGIAYKRGYCLHGQPGNGKTSLALALARKLRMDVYNLSLNALTDDDALYSCFSRLPDGCILLVEDIDKAFDHRNAKEGIKVTFSALLNVLDGAFSKHGCILIVTTNHIEKLDPALIRPGRTDLKIEIDNPTTSQIEDYLSLFYNRPVFLEEHKDLSMAAVQGICIMNRNNPTGAIKNLQGENLEMLK